MLTNSPLSYLRFYSEIFLHWIYRRQISHQLKWKENSSYASVSCGVHAALQGFWVMNLQQTITVLLSIPAYPGIIQKQTGQITHKTNLETLVNPTVMFLHCGKKMEYQERALVCTERTCTFYAEIWSQDLLVLHVFYQLCNGAANLMLSDEYLSQRW